MACRRRDRGRAAVLNYEYRTNLWIISAFAACSAVEALTVPGLFTRYFGGADFPLDRARNIFGLFGAAAAAAFASSLIATAALRLSLGPSIVVMLTLQRWFASTFLGIVTVTPLVIGHATLYCGGNTSKGLSHFCRSR